MLCYYKIVITSLFSPHPPSSPSPFLHATPLVFISPSPLSPLPSSLSSLPSPLSPLPSHLSSLLSPLPSPLSPLPSSFPPIYLEFDGVVLCLEVPALFLVRLQPMYLFLETVLRLLQFLILSCEGVGGRVGGVRGWMSVRDEGMEDVSTETREGGERR